MQTLSLFACGILLCNGVRKVNTEVNTEVNPQCSAAEAAWDNHLQSFGGQDLTKIMEDYTDESVVRLYTDEQEMNTYHGLEHIEGMFSDLFDQLNQGRGAVQVPVNIQSRKRERRCNEFLVWEWPENGIKWATDTFLFKGDKIHRQNIVVAPTTVGNMALNVALDTAITPGWNWTRQSPRQAMKSVADAWKNHFDAFEAGDMQNILLDYTEKSYIQVHHIGSGTVETFTGLAGIAGLFKGLFADLDGCTDLSSPVKEVEESERQVFLVWKCPSRKYNLVTDTFSFTHDFRIAVQNIVVQH